MQSFFNFLIGSPESDSKFLAVHLIIKAMLVAVILLVLWGLQYQAEVVYEAF